MTTREHVLEMLERLDDEQWAEVEREILLLLGSPHPAKSTGRLAASQDGNADDEVDRPYDPLGPFVGKFASNDGITDVSSNIHKYVADAIKHW